MKGSITRLIGTLLIFGAALLFYRLDTPLLWEDEGEVAIIARNIVRFGFPRTWDGEFFVTQESGHDSKLVGNTYLWSWNTWLPYYATATSFFLFGESTFTARLPFALAGVCLLLVYTRLSRTLFPQNCMMTFFTLAVLVTNTLFYLFVRQARYYAFTMLFSLSAFYFFFLFQEKGKIQYLVFYFLSIFCNFHSNFVLSFGLPLPLLLYPFVRLPLTFLYQRNIRLRSKEVFLFLCNTVFLLQSLLWVLYFQPASQSNDWLGYVRYWGGLQRVGEKVYHHLNLINSFYFPLALILLIVFLIVLYKKDNIRIDNRVTLLATGLVTHVLVISYFLQFGQKYLLSLIPVFSLLIGYLLSWLSTRSKMLALGAFALFLFTNIPYVVSERILHPSYVFSPLHVRSYFLDYLASFATEYHGPVEGIVYFFKNRGIEQATIYTDYEVESLKFYFPSYHFVSRNLAVVESKPQPTLPENYAEIANFYIPRKFWGDLGKIGACEKEVIKRDFTKHVLPYYDLEWNNLPDITYHKFFLDRSLPPLLIYEKNEKVDFSMCRRPISILMWDNG